MQPHSISEDQRTRPDPGASGNAPEVAHGEVHIAGLLVHVAPASKQSVVAAIRRGQPVEIHAEDETRLVLVAEAHSASDIVRVIDAIREMPGVYNVALVYQHAESASAMEELLDANITS